jgi:hypothetical protein
MSAATLHSIALWARGAACAVPARAPQARSAIATGFKFVPPEKRSARLPGRLASCGYCALPVPLLEELVALSLPDPVRGEASPGPAVVPVLPRAAEGAVVAPPLAAPERMCASHSEREIMPSPFLSMAEKSALPRLACLDVVPPVDGLAVGALGSPAERVLGVPPVARGEVPMLLAPEGGAPASAPPEEL